MNIEQALSVMEQALNASAQKGVFNLQDSATIYTAFAVVKQFVLANPLSEDNDEQPKEQVKSKK